MNDMIADYTRVGTGPILRADGTRVTEADPDAEVAARLVNRAHDYARVTGSVGSTHIDDRSLSVGETVVAGRWWRTGRHRRADVLAPVTLPPALPELARHLADEPLAGAGA